MVTAEKQKGRKEYPEGIPYLTCPVCESPDLEHENSPLEVVQYLMCTDCGLKFKVIPVALW